MEGEVRLTDLRKLRPAPWAVGDPHNTAPAIVNHEAIAAPNLLDERIWAVGSLQMHVAPMVKVGGHALATESVHGGTVPTAARCCKPAIRSKQKLPDRRRMSDFEERRHPSA